jgi:translation initiation factor 1 (eIF-1/SUI1)
MSRPKESHKKMDVSRPTAPLQHNPFAMLGELDALKNLAPAPEPVKLAPPIKAAAASESIRPPKAPKPVIPKNSRGRLILRREKKDRGGKTVVVISGFTELPGANAVMIANLAKELKGKLGCGGCAAGRPGGGSECSAGRTWISRRWGERVETG